MGRMGSITLHGQFSLSGSRLLPSPGTDLNRFCARPEMVLNDNDRMIVAGGRPNLGIMSASAYMYSKMEDSWTQLPDMTTARVYTSCRTITNTNGQLEVIVPGGWNLFEPGYYLSSVEIRLVKDHLYFDLDQRSRSLVVKIKITHERSRSLAMIY